MNNPDLNRVVTLSIMEQLEALKTVAWNLYGYMDPKEVYSMLDALEKARQAARDVAVKYKEKNKGKEND